MKRCTGCGEDKDSGLFYRDRGKRDGLSCRCKACLNAANKRYAKSEATLAAKRRWLEKNPGKMLALKNAWNAKNRPRVRAQFKRWYDANREYNISRGEQYRTANREKTRAAAKRWFRNNRDRARENCRARRARLAGAKGSLTAAQWRGRVEEFNGCCAYCLCPLPSVTQDHFRPLALGGEHALDNVVPACGYCNPAKGDDLIFVWLKRGVGTCPPPE